MHAHVASSSSLFFIAAATTEIYTLSLHDALPIWAARRARRAWRHPARARLGQHRNDRAPRSEEHTSELQSRQYLVCRLLLEKKERVIAPGRTTNSPRVDCASEK